MIAAGIQACAASPLTSGGWSRHPADGCRTNGDVVPTEGTLRENPGFDEFFVMRENPGFDEFFVNGRLLFSEHTQPSLLHFPRKNRG